MPDMPEEASPDWEYRERDFASEESDNIELRKRIAEKDAEIERLNARDAKWIEEVQSRLHVCYVHGKHPATADRMKPATIALQAILRAMGVEEGGGS